MTAKRTKSSAHSLTFSKSIAATRTAAKVDPYGPPLTSADRAGMRRVATVKDLRWKLSLSQEDFAAAYGIPLETLRSWERRESEASPTELAYLELIERDPDYAKATAR